MAEGRGRREGAKSTGRCTHLDAADAVPWAKAGSRRTRADGPGWPEAGGARASCSGQMVPTGAGSRRASAPERGAGRPWPRTPTRPRAGSAVHEPSRAGISMQRVTVTACLYAHTVTAAAGTGARPHPACVVPLRPPPLIPSSRPPCCALPPFAAPPPSPPPFLPPPLPSPPPLCDSIQPSIQAVLASASDEPPPADSNPDRRPPPPVALASPRAGRLPIAAWPCCDAGRHWLVPDTACLSSLHGRNPAPGRCHAAVSCRPGSRGPVQAGPGSRRVPAAWSRRVPHRAAAGHGDALLPTPSAPLPRR